MTDTVVFRVDASRHIGTGHVMRCLTLAHALKQNGYNVHFISRSTTGNINHEVRRQGFGLTALPPCTQLPTVNGQPGTHESWLECSWQQDSTMSVEALTNIPFPQWLIVDHYALDQKWQQAMRAHCEHIMVIDDLADRQHDADILLDQNLYPDAQHRYKNLLPSHCKLLLGPEYTLLRDEFIQAAAAAVPRKRLHNLLVFFGGVDASNETGKTINAIQRVERDFTTHIVIGASNPHREQLEQQCSALPDFHCHYNVSNMAQRMIEADLAIGGGGTTTWERCYLGLPSITLTLAHNQLAVNQAVAQHGACLLVGDTSITEQQLAEHLQQLVEHPEQIVAMSRAALSIMQQHTGAGGIASILQHHHA